MIIRRAYELETMEIADNPITFSDGYWRMAAPTLTAFYYMVMPDPDGYHWHRATCMGGVLSWDNTVREWGPDCKDFNEELEND